MAAPRASRRRVSLLASLPLSLLVLLPPAGVRAIFEDEVNQYEWLLQQIGKPTALAYSADAADRIFIASASGVVASVLLKDGTVQWRRMAATSKGGMRLLRASSRGLLSVMDGGIVQAWKGSTGDLSWQREYSDQVLDLLLAGPGSKQSVVILRESDLETRTLAGKQEWSVSASVAAGPQARFWAAAPEEESSICVAAATSSGSGAKALQLEASTGKVVKTAELPGSVAKGLATGSFIVADAHIVFLVGDMLTAYALCSGTQAGEAFEMRKIKSQAGPLKLMAWQRTRGVFAATNGVTTAVFGIGPRGLKHLRTFDGVAVVGPVFSVHDDETAQPVAVAVVKEESTQIQLLDPASGNVQPAIYAQGYTAGDHGNAQLLLVHELSSGEHRTVISGADHSLAGIQGQKVVWVREEALASIRQAAFYSRSELATLAERAAARSDQAGEEAGFTALVAQLGELSTSIGELLSKPVELAAFLTKFLTPKRFQRSSTSMQLLPNAQVPTSSEELREFGASKLIIAVTRAYKLFALEATTSEVIWTKYLGSGAVPNFGMDCGAGAAGNITSDCGPMMQLVPNAAAKYSELLVVLPGSKASQIMWIEPLTGKVLHQEEGPSGASVLSLMPLQRKGKQALSPVWPIIVYDSKHKVHTYPAASEEASKFLEENTERLFHYEIDGAVQAVQGYAIGKSKGKGHELVGLWNLELGSAGEKLLASGAPDHREWDHVPVHIKGDASILYKYINANVLAVVSEDTGPGNTTALNLYALDAVTGHVLQQSHVPGGSGPVHLVVCDNWILMHYRNPKKTRFELFVTEFFQAKADDGPWDILFGGRASNQTKSAHHLDTPVPLQQTYIFPAGVTSLGVTATLKGITPRSIIMAASTGHIFRISKDILNPRRPYDSKSGGDKDKDKLPAQFAATKEETIPPYRPILEMRPTDILTYHLSIGQVDGIVSSPTALESTSLVFAYGLDLFFTPVQTAKAYDVLSPGFNYLLLYLSVGSVILLWIVTAIWAQKKALLDRWR